jgi:ABC-type phosphonate transport system ATPase subunit
MYYLGAKVKLIYKREIMASIVDRPKESTEGDLLEIEKYTNGLIKFIESSATPITIGVQGEWGSGKTSLLNTIKEDLCDKNGAKHYPIWLNTWEYSLLSSPDETLIKIISGLVSQIGDLTQNQNNENGKKAAAALGSLMKGFGGVMGGFGGKAIEMAGDAIESSTTSKSSDNSIKALRVALQNVIDEAIKNSDKKAFIFFIDDLDRLDPTVAVSILELIKNLFDLKNCIFVLAIDYGVVVKGLQSKFGKMTEENEWEFRAFFDKIIQLPFSMPISSYNISKYLQSLLVDVNYFDRADLENQENLEKIAEIVSLSVGTNPRTLKRLANSVSLIEIIRGDQEISSEERIIEFALICIQIAYPTIYNLISRDPDFVNWDDQMVYSVLKNKKIDTNDLESLKETEDFDEEWEQNLWKICQISTFLKGRAHYLSRLLNFIKDNMPNIKGEEINTTIERLLSMSSVTSVSAEATVTKEKKKRDTSRYSMNGKTKLTKGKIALEIIFQYVKDNPEITYDELKELLVNKTKYERIIIPYEEAVEIKNRDRVRHFIKDDEILNLANGVKGSVTRGWSAGPGFDRLLSFAKENGYIVTNS